MQLLFCMLMQTGDGPRWASSSAERPHAASWPLNAGTRWAWWEQAQELQQTYLVKHLWVWTKGHTCRSGTGALLDAQNHAFCVQFSISCSTTDSFHMHLHMDKCVNHVKCNQSQMHVEKCQLLSVKWCILGKMFCLCVFVCIKYPVKCIIHHFALNYWHAFNMIIFQLISS